MADSASTSVPGTKHHGPHRAVDTSQLFFDLVFVFAITEVSGLIREQPDAQGCCGPPSCWP
ncbi:MULTISPECIES: hypothetical protein [Kocuria]|uniref:Low temperature requirement protein A n=1 Tax=Kocuria subflava TaxID=1736139 RepID=A0A846TU39_9MICC|nr:MULTISPECIES: hypothetical protein [Kocuria]NKE08787.1 low temperature requirement protein A [Kocuria subflava]